MGISYREYLREEAEANGPVLFSIRLTPFQAGEVEHGLSVDHDDDNLIWGWVEARGKTVAILHVTNVDHAVYRITSSRDIFQDNVSSGWDRDMTYAAGARSLEKLIGKLIEAAGGLDAVSPEFRRWV